MKTMAMQMNMVRTFLFTFILLLSFFSPSFSSTNNSSKADTKDQTEQGQGHEQHPEQDKKESEKILEDAFRADEDHHEAPLWTVVPFIALLLMIATGPLFYEHFWHKNYPAIAIALAAIVVFYAIFIQHNIHGPVHALAEYVQFISLLTSLYIASGGIMINIDKKASPVANTILLISGAIISNLIGTTGASMLLIKPFIRLNKNRIKPYHIIFFIFMVSNVGGSLTPIGDPPLFLGFLKGVPFFWTMVYNFAPWAFALLVLAFLFYLIDSQNKSDYSFGEPEPEYSNKISLIGAKNFLWLAVVIIAVFIDPNVLDWVPAIHYDGQKFSFIREIIMLSVAFFSYKLADKKAIKENDFSFEPIREVAFIFIGIFGTMMPALEMVGNFAQSPEGSALITHNSLFWGTGVLSGFLDNAPTYLNFLAAAMASDGANINVIEQVQAYAEGSFPSSILDLRAISVAAVFFGAMTYIGNGPNFMVKSISEQIGIKMPSFFGYIIRFSLPVLLPLLVLVWLVFFAFQ